MSDVINPSLQWLNAHPNLAGLATFIISAAESVAIIGTIVPGTIVMMGIGALIGAGVIPLWSTLIWAILGAMLGDGISYWVGYYFKDHMRQMWPFRTNPHLLASGERFFLKYGGMSVFIGRFVGPVRALIPVVAGMLRMQPLRFTLANISSAILWAPIYLLPGIIIGAASLELSPDIAIHAVSVCFLVGLLIVLCLWLVYQICKLISSRIHRMLNWTWVKLLQSPKLQFIPKLLRHHDLQKSYGQLALAFYLFIAIISFIALALTVYIVGSSHLTVNNIFFYLLRSMRTDTANQVAIWFTILGEKKVIFPSLGVGCLWLIYKRNWHIAAHGTALLILTGGSIFILKRLIHSPRPWGIVNGPDTFSFPSGHSTLATVFYFGFFLLLIKISKDKWRKLFFSLVSLLVICISGSRLYLGAHWFTDVLGGWLLASCLLIFITISFQRYHCNTHQLKNGLLVSFLALVLAAGLFHHMKAQTYLANYAIADWPIINSTTNAWWDQTGEALPRFRAGRIGTASEILNLQWLGNLDKIHDFLLAEGWQSPPKINISDILFRVADISSDNHLPLVSPLYLDHSPTLVLTKSVDKKLIVLRLWQANLHMTDNANPLWVGTVGYVPRTYSWLLPAKRKSNLSLPAHELFNLNPEEFTMKVISLVFSHEKSARREYLNKDYHPQILLIKQNP